MQIWSTHGHYWVLRPRGIVIKDADPPGFKFQFCRVILDPGVSSLLALSLCFFL